MARWIERDLRLFAAGSVDFRMLEKSADLLRCCSQRTRSRPRAQRYERRETGTPPVARRPTRTTETCSRTRSTTPAQPAQ
eukprot:2405426-Prorocentrum_lima.AAC.1